MNDATTTLPSELYEEYKKQQRSTDDDDDNNDSNDHEAILQNLLSVLSTLDQQSPPRTQQQQQQQQLQQSTIGGTQHSQEDKTVVDWIWERLTQSSLSEDVVENDDNDDDKTNRHSREYCYDFEWSMGLRYIHYLLPHVISSPFELHAIARQSILMCEDEVITSRHCVLCLLLCCMALQQCRSDNDSNTPLTRRWKRWQSITCETICMFQTRGFRLVTSSSSSAAADDDEDEGHSAVADQSYSGLVIDLWTRFVAPSCLNVVRVLPIDAYHVALFAGLIGTTLKVVENVVAVDMAFRSSGMEGLPLRRLLSLYETMQSICETRPVDGSSLYQLHYSEFTVWRDPWRPNESATSRTMPMDTVGRHDDLDFWIHRNDLSWWIHRNADDETQERVADMDTTWSRSGISLLASIAFHERALVYHPTYVWMVWFPHVTTLLKSSSSSSLFLEDWHLTFIQRLIDVTPVNSLSIAMKLNNSDNNFHHHHHHHHHDHRACPDSPLEVFQLLSNRMMIARPTTILHKDITPDDEEEQMMAFRSRSERFVGIMKGLLSRYTTTCQVHIVERLIKDCTNPGLQARFLDLLRPILFDADCEEDLGILLMSILGDYLWTYWHKSRQHIVKVDELIQNVEVSIGAITMIRLWYMVRGNVSHQNFEGLEDTMKGFVHTLQRLLDGWSNNNSTMVEAPAIQGPPEAWHRLFLLDSAIQSLLDVMIR